jgi:hypothetical protein
MESDDDPTQQQSEQHPADSDQPSAQVEEQPADQADVSTEQPQAQPTETDQAANQAADSDQAGEQPAETSDQSAGQTDEQAINESDQPAEEEEQPDDDCSGWEQDPVSFSTYVAKYVAKMQIAPNVDVLAKSVACKDERHCDVTLSNGVVMRVAWEPSTRITLGRWDSNGVVLRSIYKYSCRGGQLILTFKDFRRGPT